MSQWLFIPPFCISSSGEESFRMIEVIEWHVSPVIMSEVFPGTITIITHPLSFPSFPRSFYMFSFPFCSSSTVLITSLERLPPVEYLCKHIPDPSSPLGFFANSLKDRINHNHFPHKLYGGRFDGYAGRKSSSSP